MPTWGAANCVTFDSGKESFHILSHDDSFGNSFRLLGVTFDLQLRMDTAVHECCTEAHWRLSALLRSRRFFSRGDLVVHYKSQILSYVEYRTCAITHAADTHLHHLDSVQRRLLQNLDISPLEALHQFNLAPLPRGETLLTLEYCFERLRGEEQNNFKKCLSLIAFFADLLLVDVPIAFRF